MITKDIRRYDTMKKTILMAFASVIAFSVVQYDTHANATTSTSTTTQTESGFKKAFKKIKNSKFVQKLKKAAKETVITTGNEYLTAEAATINLQNLQNQLSTSINTLKTQCKTANSITPNAVYTNIIQKLETFEAQTKDDVFTLQYNEAYTTITAITDACKTLGVPFTTQADSILACFLQIKEVKIPEATVQSSTITQATATTQTASAT